VPDRTDSAYNREFSSVFQPLKTQSSHTHWVWFETSFNVNVGNNDEYAGTLITDQVGVFDYLYRYSGDGGETWYYGTLAGPVRDLTNYNAADAGQLTVEVCTTDTTPPDSPLNLRLTSVSDSTVTLAWDASTATDVYAYNIYRKLATDTGYPATPLATVITPTTNYTDESVVTDETYDYQLTAVDNCTNESTLPAELLGVVAQTRTVDVTFSVMVPEATPPTVYIAGNFDEFEGSMYPRWDPSGIALTETSPDVWEVTLTLPDFSTFDYKYVRGDWTMVEKEADGVTETSNRSVTAEYGMSGTQTVTETVANWRDPFVVDFAPADGVTDVPQNTVVTLTWNQAMLEDLGAAFTLSNTAGAITGTLTYDASTFTHTFTPDAPLPVDTYTVNVSGATDAAGGDVQLIDTVFTFGVVDAGVAPAITSPPPPNGELNQPYTHTYTATGDTPITYTVTSGALPDGLTLSGDTISGTATIRGTFIGEVTATNAIGSDVQAFNIVIGNVPIRTYPFDGQILNGSNAAQWPAFTFEHLDGAEWYGMWIGRSDGSYTGLYQWFPATATSTGITTETPICDTTANICTIPVDVWMVGGDASWWMTYWGPTFPASNSYWNESTFSVNFNAPTTGALTNVTPSGAVNTAPTEIIWERDPNVLWMEIWLGQVVGPNGTPYTIFYGWVDATTICDATTCTLDFTGLSVPDGEYEMWMRLWGPGGYLQWTDVNDGQPAATFTVDTGN
jgi:hypothetical protein